VDGNMVGSPFTLHSGGRLRGGGVVGNVTAGENNTGLLVDSKFPNQQGGELEVGNFNLPLVQFSQPGCAVQLDFFGPSFIGGNDSIRARGTVTLNGAILFPSFRYAPREGDVIEVINKLSAGAISGTFLGLPQNSLITVDNIACRVSYTNINGNDVTLTVTNLPLSFAGAFVFSGNGNESIEGNECVLLNVWLRNKRGTALTATNVQLRTSFPLANVMVTITESTYPPIPAGGVMFGLTPFQIRTTSNFVCGASVFMELQVTVPGEGTFAVPFTVFGSTNCGTPGGGACESCTVVSGQFTTNIPTMAVRPYFVGGSSLCFPTKACPGADPDTNLPPARFLTHAFTNTTAREICVSVQARLDCANPANAIGVSAYLGGFDPNELCAGYLGDGGVVGGPVYRPFSFRVPASSNFVLVVTERTNIDCSSYTLELFGLPCPPPTLNLTASATARNVVAQWSSAYPDVQLQSVNSLDGPGPYNFINVATTPVLIDGKYTQSNAVAAPRQFFRLAK